MTRCADLRIVPACCGYVSDAPESDDSKWTSWCSSSDCFRFFLGIQWWEGEREREDVERGREIKKRDERERGGATSLFPIFQEGIVKAEQGGRAFFRSRTAVGLFRPSIVKLQSFSFSGPFLWRAGRPARQDRPVDLAHHVQFFGEGAELRTTRRGEESEEKKEREVKGKQEAEKTKKNPSSKLTIFFRPPLNLNSSSSSSTTPRLPRTFTNRRWPRPQKPPWPKSRRRRRRQARSRLLLRAAAASRPRSPSPSSRRWRASTPMVKKLRDSVFFSELEPPAFSFVLFFVETATNRCLSFRAGKMGTIEKCGDPLLHGALERALKESVARQHRDCK